MCEFNKPVGIHRPTVPRRLIPEDGWPVAWEISGKQDSCGWASGTDGAPGGRGGFRIDSDSDSQEISATRKQTRMQQDHIAGFDLGPEILSSVIIPSIDG